MYRGGTVQEDIWPAVILAIADGYPMRAKRRFVDFGGYV